MSAEIRERLLKHIPPHLNVDQKYSLIKKLWLSYRERSKCRLEFSIAANELSGSIADIIVDTCKNNIDGHIPEQVKNGLHWLQDDDARALELLIRRVEIEETKTVEQIVLRELHDLAKAADYSSGVNFSGCYEFEIPYGKIVINFLKGSGIQKRMADNTKKDLVAIAGSNDLLTKALNSVSQETVEAIGKKAAEEALRLKTKRTEGEIDRQMAADKIDDAVSHAHRLNRSKVSFNIESEHKSEHGRTSVNINNRGACFVATACFGDYSHPTVVKLRTIRDEFLLRQFWGRVFVKFYYRFGPYAAKQIQGEGIKKGFRFLFNAIADNWSTKGNVNPFTGKRGSKR
jgi:hypothetical protein